MVLCYIAKFLPCLRVDIIFNRVTMPCFRSPFFPLISCYSIIFQETKKVDRIDDEFLGPKHKIARDWSTAPLTRLKEVRSRRALPSAAQVGKEIGEDFEFHFNLFFTNYKKRNLL